MDTKASSASSTKRMRIDPSKMQDHFCGYKLSQIPQKDHLHLATKLEPQRPQSSSLHEMTRALRVNHLAVTSQAVYMVGVKGVRYISHASKQETMLCTFQGDAVSNSKGQTLCLLTGQNRAFSLRVAEPFVCLSLGNLDAEQTSRKGVRILIWKENESSNSTSITHKLIFDDHPLSPGVLWATIVDARVLSRDNSASSPVVGLLLHHFKHKPTKPGAKPDDSEPTHCVRALQLFPRPNDGATRGALQLQMPVTSTFCLHQGANAPVSVFYVSDKSFCIVSDREYTSGAMLLRNVNKPSNEKSVPAEHKVDTEAPTGAVVGDESKAVLNQTAAPLSEKEAAALMLDEEEPLGDDTSFLVMLFDLSGIMCDHVLLEGRGEQFLCHSQDATGNTLVGLKEREDMVLAQVSTNGQSLSMTHQTTFGGLGYVQEGKQHKKFFQVLLQEPAPECDSNVPPSNDYAIIAEFSRFVYIYQRPQGKSPSAPQFVVEFDSSTEVLGAQMRRAEGGQCSLYILTTEELLTCTLK